MNFTRLRVILLALAVTCTNSRANEYPWPDRGVISLTSAKNWEFSVDYLAAVGIEINAESKSPNQATLQIRFISLPVDNPLLGSSSQERLRSLMGPAIASSVEKRIKPIALKLAQGTGWYGEVTDASLVGKPIEKGNFKVMRQADIAFDATTFAVATMQFDAPAGSEPTEMLAMIESLRFIPASASKALAITSSGDCWTLHMPSRAVSLRLPRTLEPSPWERADNSKPDPDYFSFERHRQMFYVEGNLRSAADFKGKHDLSKKFIEHLGRDVKMAPKNVSFSQIGDWDVVIYDDDALRGAHHTNIRAELVRDDTWIYLWAHAGTRGDIQNARAQLVELIRSLVVTPVK
jgi:hypothetical protein